MRIKVKFEDVRRGYQRMGDNCIVALAIKRQVPEFADRISVGSYNVSLIFGGRVRLLALPSFVTLKIDAFDRHRWVWPFSFELPLERVLEAKEASCAKVEELAEPVLA